MISLDKLPIHEKDEKVELFLRRHRFVIFKDFLMLIFLGLAPFLLYFFFTIIMPSVFENQFIYISLVLGFSLYYFYIWLTFFHQFVDYYLDVWIVTNRRIINIEQKGLFHRTISEQRLYRIQDVTSDVKGIIPTMLRFGDIHVQSAGEQHWFNFKQVPNPYEIRKRILELVEKDRMSLPDQKYNAQDYEDILGNTGAK